MEIHTDKEGNKYGLINGKLIPIVSQEASGKTASKKANNSNKKLVQAAELESIIKAMNNPDKAKMFGKLNTKEPYSIKLDSLWEIYELPKGNKYSLSKRVKRELIIPAQIEQEHLGKRAITQVWANAKKQLEKSKQSWEQNDKCYPNQKTNAIKWLDLEIQAVNTLMNRAG